MRPGCLRRRHAVPPCLRSYTAALTKQTTPTPIPTEIPDDDETFWSPRTIRQLRRALQVLATVPDDGTHLDYAADILAEYIGDEEVLRLVADIRPMTRT